jgi:hypothetical protein
LTGLRPTVIERAFELAKSGDCASPSEIRDILRREGYMDVTGQIAGPTLLKQLRTLCRDAVKPSEESTS